MTAPPAPPATQAARIVIADDHHLARAGLRHVFEDQAELTVVGEAEDGEQLLGLVERLKPDIAVVDVRMPRLDGIEATRQIRARFGNVAVVIVTIVDDPDALLEALRAGAHGYVLKDVGPQELVSVVQRALTGVCTIEPGLASVLLQRLATGADTTPARPEPLTPRELEILRLVAQGQTNRQIAGRLIMAVGTVKIHVEHILAKLGVADRTQAAVRGVELGLVGGDSEARDATTLS